MPSIDEENLVRNEVETLTYSYQGDGRVVPVPPDVRPENEFSNFVSERLSMGRLISQGERRWDAALPYRATEITGKIKPPKLDWSVSEITRNFSKTLFKGIITYSGEVIYEEVFDGLKQAHTQINTILTSLKEEDTEVNNVVDDDF